MFRGLKSILRHTDDPSPRRSERRCLPTLTGSASCLEDRLLLSGASAHVAEVARTAANLANTHAGHIVTSLYESILGTDPTSAQLTTWVHKMRSGVSTKVLRKDLVATARVEQLKAADPPVSAVVAGTNLSAAGLTVFGSSSAINGSSFRGTSAFRVNTLPTAINPSTVGLNVSQAPNMNAFRAGLFGGSGSGSGSTLILSSGSSHATGSTASATLGTTTGTTTTSSSVVGTTSTTSLASPLQSLDSSTSVPTPGLTTSTGSITSTLGQLGLSQVGLSQVGLSQLAVTPALTVSTTAPDAAANGLTIAPSTGVTIAPSTGLTVAPSTGLTVAPSSNLI